MLTSDSLHQSLGDPAISGVEFLNEIIDRYPSAISFAPGAPQSGFFAELDIGNCITTYARYLHTNRRLSRSSVTRLLFQYGPNKGIINELLAESLKKDHQLSVDPESVVITVGCQEGMLLVLRALMRDPSDVLIVVAPCFPGILGAARLLDITVLPIDEVDGVVPLDSLQALCHSVRTRGGHVRAVYLGTDFANPSGTSLDLRSRHQLLAMASVEDFLIMEDSTYAFTADPNAALPSLKSLDGPQRRVIYLGTFAKVLAPGARVGYVVADQRVSADGSAGSTLAAQLARIKSAVSVNTSPICQAIVGGMLLMNGCSIASLGSSRARFYRQNLRYLLGALDRHLGESETRPRELRWTQPMGGFFVRMTLQVPVDFQLLRLAAEKYGVLWTPMSMFYLGNVKSHQLRLSCSYLREDEIEEGVIRLSHFISDPACKSPQ